MTDENAPYFINESKAGVFWANANNQVILYNLAYISHRLFILGQWQGAWL
ncbi:MAG TPA: hypothetical protein VIJ25_02405 [Methylococcales bacterium]